MYITTRNKIPQYLQKGAFYEALDSNDEEGFEVPSDCFKPDLVIRSDEDLRQLLKSLRFWAVYQMPNEILAYILKSPKNPHESLLLEFPEFKDHLSKIIALKGCSPMNAVTTAIYSGLGIEAVKYLTECMGYALDSHCQNLVVAAMVDDVASFIFVHEKEPGKYTSLLAEITRFSALNGSVKCLKYAHAEGWEIPSDAITFAAGNGKMECVKYLREVCGLAYGPKTMLLCAEENCDLALIRYLHETGCPWDEKVTEAFAMADKLDCLMYAHEKGCPWGPGTCAMAASYGHLRCIEYAHQQGCSWDAETTGGVIMGDYPHCLAYIIDNNCPMSDITPILTVVCLPWRCMWYLLQRGGDYCDFLSGMIFFTGVCLVGISYLCGVEPMSLWLFFVAFLQMQLTDPLSTIVATSFRLCKEKHDIVRTGGWISCSHRGRGAAIFCTADCEQVTLSK